MRRSLRTVTVSAALAALTVLATGGTASSHGYTDQPPSRQALCAGGTVTGCGDIQYEPQSVEGPKGFPSAGPADGSICAGGNSRFAQLDDPRGGQWPATKVTAGQRYTFTWRFTARHATTDFKYYLTKQGYDPTKPLTRSELDTTPFLTVPMNGTQPGSTASHTGTIPGGRTGKQLIVAVWTIADTSNAFYACSDVQF
ncbi:lytic polysaccharide monooxygenase [Streptomyces sp. NPDC059740]|uniref:lytic polysaccharide monooxygenase auxiliary activity family 9 protein n=1 Tax=Streptomyces sp. NPDC059740 TaxID=3346926 RepID=UPI0036460399